MSLLEMEYTSPGRIFRNLTDLQKKIMMTPLKSEKYSQTADLAPLVKKFCTRFNILPNMGHPSLLFLKQKILFEFWVGIVTQIKNSSLRNSLTTYFSRKTWEYIFFRKCETEYFLKKYNLQLTITCRSSWKFYMLEKSSKHVVPPIYFFALGGRFF